MSKFPALGQHDFRTDRFSKAEYQWFRLVTLYLRRQDVLADVADTVITSVTFPTVTSANASDLPTAITLANELKADVNTMAGQLQALMGELAAQNAALNEILEAMRQRPVPVG